MTKTKIATTVDVIEDKPKKAIKKNSTKGSKKPATRRKKKDATEIEDRSSAIEKPIKVTKSRANAEKSLAAYKLASARIARQLGYSREIIARVQNATTHGEVERAMVTGRKLLRD